MGGGILGGGLGYVLGGPVGALIGAAVGGGALGGLTPEQPKIDTTTPTAPATPTDNSVKAASKVATPDGQTSLGTASGNADGTSTDGRVRDAEEKARAAATARAAAAQTILTAPLGITEQAVTGKTKLGA